MLLLGIFVGIIVALVFANFMPAEKRLDELGAGNYSVDDPQFLRSMGTLFGAPLIDGNSVTELINGSRIFPPMLEAIRGAQKTITFETFIYWSGDIGRQFADALAERAKAKVKVLVLLDFVGSTRMDRELLEKMQAAGCEVVKFHPLKWYHLSRMNNRTHRKLLIVDGKIGFTGGVGIGEEWTGDAHDEFHWRDTHFKVVGPVVGQMQATFMINWMKARAKVEHTEDFFPALENSGTQFAQMFHSSPEEGSDNIRLMYLLSIAAARRTIYLEQAYFLPDDMATDMLVAAARRGVKVEIIVPGPKIDTKLVRRASRARWGRLLEAGIRIYEYQPTNFHCKVMVVDGRWSSVGSTNFDNRSFRLNDEANLNVYDAPFAAQLERTFEKDKLLSRETSYEEWKRRPFYQKTWEWFWGLFHKQM